MPWPSKEPDSVPKFIEHGHPWMAFAVTMTRTLTPVVMTALALFAAYVGVKLPW